MIVARRRARTFCGGTMGRTFAGCKLVRLLTDGAQSLTLGAPFTGNL